MYSFKKKSSHSSRSCFQCYQGMISPGSRSENLRRYIFMHVKSFFKKYHPGGKCKFQFGLIRQSFLVFKAIHPHQVVSYKIFRQIFYNVLAELSVDNTYRSNMPNAILLRKACRRCNLTRSRQNVSAADTQKHKNSVKIKAPSLKRKEGEVFTKNKEKCRKNENCVKKNKKIIMHLDIDNDDVVITQNVSDSDTENEGSEINIRTARNGNRNFIHQNSKIPELNSRLPMAKKLKLNQVTENRQPLLSCTCKKQCRNRLSESRQQKIYKSFCDLESSVEQERWISKHIQRSDHGNISGKQRETVSYFLTDETNQPVPVCSEFFQGMLGFASRDQAKILYTGSSRDQRGREEPKLNRYIKKYLEQCINNPNNIGKHVTNSHVGVKTRTGFMKQLHSNFLLKHPQFSVTYEIFTNIFKDVQKTSVELRDKRKADALPSTGHSSKSRKFRKSRKRTDARGSGFELPERRRSTRTTRMQGSMAEDSFLEFEEESRLVSSSVPGHADQFLDQRSDPEELVVKRNSRHGAKCLLRVERLPESKHTDSQHQGLSYEKAKWKRKSRSESSDQFAAKCMLNFRHRKGNSSRSHNKNTKDSSIRLSTCSRHKKKKEKEDDDLTLKSNDNKKEMELSSKKQHKLHSLKKYKHPMLPPCSCSRRKCIKHIPEERRREIHEIFWNLISFRDRKQWLMKFVERRERKFKLLSLFPHRKNEAKRYFLPNRQGQAVEVCRQFFIHTLGFRWDSVVDSVVKMKPTRMPSKESYVLRKPRRQLPEYIVDSVKQYLKSVRDLHSASKAPETLSSELAESLAESKNGDLPGLKVKDLFVDWKSKHKDLKFNLGYHSFRRVFQSMVEPVAEVIGGDEAKVTEGCISEDMNSDMEHDVDELPNYEPVMETDIMNPLSQDVKPDRCSTPTSGENHDPQMVIEDKMFSSEQKDVSECGKMEVSVSLMEKGNKGICSTDVDSHSSDHSTKKSSGVDGCNVDECILDVGSGYFRRVGGVYSSSKSDMCFYEHKYKKRQSLSMRNDRNNYPVLPPCKCWKRKCAERFSEAQRQKVNDMFWSLGSYNERKQWILEHIKRADIKRRVVFTESMPRKLESRWYYLPDDDGNKVDVCKAFFLRTLGYRWDSVIDTIGKTTPKGEKWAVPDKRGCKPPPHKMSEEAVSSMTLYIENVCQTYQFVHQQRNQTSKKGTKTTSANMIPYGLTMKQLFEDYKSKHLNHKFGYESFRKVFRRVHGDYVASLAQDAAVSKEPEPVYSDEAVASCDVKDYQELAAVECGGDFQPEDSHFVPSSEPCSNIGHFTTPASQAPPPPLSSRDQVAQQQLLAGDVPESRSCLYQYGSQLGDPMNPPAPRVSDNGGPSAQDHFNSTVDHDQFLKYGHDIYCPPVGVPGHISQVSDHFGYSSGLGSHSDMIDPSSCRGQNQFPPYFMPNPEPLRCQVFQVASQYQSILHQLAESRFFNYGNFPVTENGFQRNHDNTNQDFHRESVNPYSIHKGSYSSASGLPAESSHYPPVSHPPHSNTQGSTAMILSSYCDENDNSFAPEQDEGLMTADQDMDNSDFQVVEQGTKPASECSSSAKRPQSENPQIKKQKKFRSKSVRNYGDHYPMLSPCHCKKKKCAEKFSENDRQRIHDLFWDLKDYNERKQWMLLHIKREDCRRRRIDQFESFRKQESRWYFFPDEEGNQHEVCKDFFLRTLGYKWDSVIDTIKRTTPKGETNTRPDQRGRKAPAHKLSSVVLRSVVQYIESMQQVSRPLSASSTIICGKLHKIEQTCDQNGNDNGSASDISVPYGLTMKDLYDDYKAKHMGHKIGYESFRRIFRALAKSEKIVLNEKSAEDQILNPDSQDLVDF